MRVAVLASTNGTDMDALLDEQEDFEFALVLCDRECGALERAKANNIPNELVIEKDRAEFAAKTMKILDDYKIDLVVLIGFMKFIDSSFVQKWENKVMNIHPSLLPAFAGGMNLNVHKEVLKRGCKLTGCTLHFVDEGADTGPIIAQKSVAVTQDDTPESLRDKVQTAEKEVILDAVTKYAKGKIRVVDNKVLFS